MNGGGSGFNPFMGFSALSSTGGSSENFSYASLDGDTVVILRKLSKRDQVTKIKALEELENSVKCMDLDSLENLMSYWVR